ncbi:MAG TPA: 23S rRNA (uracil(1939)-C(5))-methyltransferase RlmD [Parachlamydiales bacterium]|nr:23S rRNA (uracil(1939)-C(5))-methyltransferase RlmD [Parachlamydiales bacterium]
MKPKPRFNQKINLTIQRLGIYGEGVGYWHGYTVFVEGALPGEVIQARLCERKKAYGRAATLSCSRLSPHRVLPSCPLFGRCGGCQIMHLDYNEQLVLKRQRVIDSLERIGKLKGIEVLPCLPSPSSLHYRNKIQLPVVPSENGLKIGLYARNSHDLVEMEKCFIHAPLGEKVLERLLPLLKASSVTAYDPKTGSGELRYLLIKSALSTDQAMVILVTKGAPSRELCAFAHALKETCGEVRGVVRNENESADNTVLGSSYQLLVGEGAIEERLLGLSFKVSPASFFQVNPLQAEVLYKQALSLADLQGDETLLDAYCGVGALSLLMAQRAGKVLGIDCVSQAIADAKNNAQNNQICNVEFACGLAEEFIPTLRSLDVALLNPPRRGCDSSLLQRLSELAPRRILYISCDPATLARDLAFLNERGFSIDTVQPFDMFPQTAHVETLVCLDRDFVQSRVTL